jgi:nitrogen regulatory protein PII
MKLAKRLEIVSDSVELSKIIERLESAGISSYTVIHNVSSRGLHGTAFDDSAVTMLDNTYVIAFCSPDKIEAVVEAIRPVLNKFGGSCWITDAMEICSVKCIAS